MSRCALVLVLLLPAGPALADPTMECSLAATSQVETRDCLARVEETVDGALAVALSFAESSAGELDAVTGRAVAAPALATAQAAWSAYRDAQCAFVAAGFGGGSGAGIAERDCRITLGRARTDELMNSLR